MTEQAVKDIAKQGVVIHADRVIGRIPLPIFNVQLHHVLVRVYASGLVVVVGVSWAALSAAQRIVPRLDSQAAKTHVGEIATVCGQVVETSCRDSSGDVLLMLAPESDPAPVRIRIAATSKERLGPGVPHRYDHRVVCTVGTINRVNAGYEVVPLEPQLITEAFESNATSQPVFAPGAFGTCDANVRLPTVIREVKPRFPSQADGNKVASSVVMLAVVKPDGTVGDISVRRSLGEHFDRAAIEAARQWRFRPGLHGDTPVPMAVGISMMFLRK